MQNFRISYEVTVRRMNCLPDPPEPEVPCKHSCTSSVFLVYGINLYFYDVFLTNFFHQTKYKDGRKDFFVKIFEMCMFVVEREIRSNWDMLGDVSINRTQYSISGYVNDCNFWKEAWRIAKELESDCFFCRDISFPCSIHCSFCAFFQKCSQMVSSSSNNIVLAHKYPRTYVLNCLQASWSWLRQDLEIRWHNGHHEATTVT